jgi:quercetin dioxygenase-like cupin family protein
MNKRMSFSLALAVLFVGAVARAQDRRAVVPQLLLSEIVQGMPRGDRQNVRVLTANFQPGEKTMLHTHPFPVTVYVLEGAFTLEVQGREPVTVKAGQAMVMPTHTKMTGYNRSSTEPLRLVIFSVSDPDAPFLEPIH